MLKEYHLNWLIAHPHRTQEWLADKLKDGFDIHHLDGDHSNNSKENLVLIDHSDHMYLHGMNLGTLGRMAPKKKIKRLKRVGPYTIGRHDRKYRKKNNTKRVKLTKRGLKNLLKMA